MTSTEDEKANKGRSQVMNLLTIDTTTVSSMATYVWTITNGIVRRRCMYKSRADSSYSRILVHVLDARRQCLGWTGYDPATYARFYLDLKEELRLVARM